MNRDYGAGSCRDSLSHALRVYVAGFWVNVSEDWCSSGPSYSAGGSDKSKRRGDHFVAGFDSCCHERKDQSISSRSTGHCEAAAHVLGNLRFQPLHFRSEDKVLGFQNAGYSSRYLIANLLELFS